MPKLAKTVALRLAEKAKDEKAKETSLQQQREQKNVRNKSTNIPSNTAVNKNGSAQSNPSPTNPNIPLMNKSGTGIKRPDNLGMVKLPKVSTIGSSSVSNSSMKAIWEGGGKRSGHEGSRE